jgi:hypothetical protein
MGGVRNQTTDDFPKNPWTCCSQHIHSYTLEDVDEILGVSDGQGVPSVTVNVSNGDIIEISGLEQVSMTPAS